MRRRRFLIENGLQIQVIFRFLPFYRALSCPPCEAASEASCCPSVTIRGAGLAMVTASCPTRAGESRPITSVVTGNFAAASLMTTKIGQNQLQLGSQRVRDGTD